MSPHNTYEYRFTAVCPTDSDLVEYHLTIRLPAGMSVRAEKIRRLCDRIFSGFHEDIANRLAAHLPGQQTLVASHRGVVITTIRGKAR